MEHLVTTLGILLAAAAFLAIVLRLARQSSIIAFIAVGVIAGLSKGFHIPHDILEVFTEIGIILLLFMAGLEVEFDSVRKMWKRLLGNALGQIATTAVLGAVLGYLLLDLTGAATIVYFGLCLTFSSTIVVLGYLKTKREMDSYHGQIILGLMVLQDVTAVLALVVLGSLTGEGSMTASIGMMLLKLAGLGILLFLMAKFVLEKLFRHLAGAKELLFVGSLGWALGVAALCDLFDFSPEIGAFMAGAALSFLPYKLEIQDKVEPMKDFGVILFFVALGYGLKIDRSAISLVVPAIAVSAFVLFGTPLIMLTIGYLGRQKSRPTFMIGIIVNQISEFSLILATLCVQANVFDDRIFLLITISTVVTIFLSSLGQQTVEPLYRVARRPLRFIDRHSRAVRDAGLKFELRDHLVVVKYNELAEKVIDHFLSAGSRVLLIDIDPDVYHTLETRHEKLQCMYADFFDPDTRDDAGFRDAAGIVSCLINGQDAELGVLRWLKDAKLDVPFVAATDSHAEALELYEAGATYVIQTEELAAERLGELLAECGTSLKALATESETHKESLVAASAKPTFRFH